ncbi:MAG: TIR domain-containing protein [Pseudomonadaceae bacterium]|nr:TIR domain-containing protein [Pseudomonadaceae bacterium]
MSDIFVSYAREDRDRIAPLVAELESAGFSLWWDRDISPGHSFSARIEEELDAASAVIVAWSEHSVSSNWVQAEATEGLDRGVLVPVLLDDSRVPLPFRRLQSAMLQHYPKQPESEQIEQLKSALGTLLAKTPKPPPVLSSPAGERPATKRAILSAGIFAAVSVAAGSWFWSHDQTTTAPSSQLFFEPVAVEDNDASRVLGSLVEEVALGLQGLHGVSVILPDKEALPSGLSVQTSASGESVSLRVIDTAAKTEVLKRSYAIDDGFNEVQNRISADIADLFDSPAPRRSYANSRAYRDYLVITSLLREVPSASVLAKAEAQLSELTDKHPKFARAFAQLCSLKITMYKETTDTEHFEAAEKNCHRALTLDDQDNEVRLSLARLYLAAGRHERALDEVRHVGQELRNSSRIHRLLGEALEALGNDASALAAYQAAFRIEPNYWRNANKLGGYYFDRAEYKTAADYYGIETDLVRNKARSLNNLAGALFMSGDESAAIAAWRSSAEIEMTINTAMNLGSALFYAEDFPGSAGYYREALSLAPEDHRIYGHLADAQLASNDPRYGETYELAIEKALAVLKITPDNARLTADLASYYSAIGDETKALLYLEQIADDRNDIDVIYDKLVSRIRLQDFAAATELRSHLLASHYPEELLDRDANVKPLARYAAQP